jgi:hypothetical protein
MGSILLNSIYRPWYQALFCIVLMLVLVAIIRPDKEDSLWVIAGLSFVLFMLLNSAMIWASPTQWTYFFLSLLISVAYLFAANVIVTGYVSSFNVKGSGESSMIFLVIIYHPFALLLVMFVKWLYFKFI